MSDTVSQSASADAPGFAGQGVTVTHVSQGVQGAIYVGRSTRGRKGSPLANPYVIGRDGDRGMVIAKFRVDLENALLHGGNAMATEFDRLLSLYRERGHLVLACWCAPLPCHADVIRREIIIRMLVARRRAHQ